MKVKREWLSDALVRISAVDNLKQKKGPTVLCDTSGNVIEAACYQDGLFSGEYKRYYPNGHLLEQGDLIKNVPQGLWKVYNVDRSIRCVYVYSRGKVVEKHEGEKGALFLKKNELKYKIQLFYKMNSR